MRKQESGHKVKNGEKYGVFNVTDNWIESHHRSLNSAKKVCAKRQKHWGKDMSFEVVELEV
jgi:hypothetical protein